MFQTFAASTSPDQGPPRLAALRKLMAERGFDGTLVPRADAHQGEYVAPCDERLAWLTGFTGSAGFAIVTSDKAAVFVDGRYTLQARNQVAEDFEIVHWPATTAAQWLEDNVPSDATMAFDPWLYSVSDVKALGAKAPQTFTPAPNLIDAIWDDRPAPPDAPFFPQPDDLAGETSDSKIARLAKGLGADQALITLPDSIAWLLNIRGADIPRNPVPHALALLSADATVRLFARPGKAEQISQTTEDVATLPEALAALKGKTLIDPDTCPTALADAIGGEITHGPDPCLLPKARKNDAEIAGARAAHLRDGAAMVRFLAWLDGEAPKGGLTEIDVVQRLEHERRATNALQEISFETICGAGVNGAIVHYRVTEGTNAPVKPGELLLVDSGGQYVDGTTDITRTVAVGEPTDEHRHCYTLVLRGMIAVSQARFPKGVGGQHLDALARMPLWRDGKDYDHGTGHGVGAYLSVHEGPQSLSRSVKGAVPFEPGMILSNEPGYYREGAFGIRIENLIVTQEAPALPGQDDRPWLDFETLTYVPMDRRLIDPTKLTEDERAWVDAYHRETLHRLKGELSDPATVAWLEQACAPLVSPS